MPHFISILISILRFVFVNMDWEIFIFFHLIQYVFRLRMRSLRQTTRQEWTEMSWSTIDMRTLWPLQFNSFQFFSRNAGVKVRKRISGRCSRIFYKTCLWRSTRRNGRPPSYFSLYLVNYWCHSLLAKVRFFLKTISPKIFPVLGIRIRKYIRIQEAKYQPKFAKNIVSLLKRQISIRDN